MKKIFSLIIAHCIAVITFANNVNISNISILTGITGIHKVQFDLGWENSWRVSTVQNNYDGVWVFFKYRVPGGNWQHITLSGKGHSLNDDFNLHLNTGTKYGAVIYPAADFAGTATITGAQLEIQTVLPFNIEVRGFAIEMVYIPQCSNCVIGDGDGTGESTYAFHTTNNFSGAFGTIFNVDLNGFDDGTMEGGILISDAGISGLAIPTNTAFTTGQAFWCMKYEISQAGYRDFLNTLTLAQQTSRTVNSPTSATGTNALVPPLAPANRNFIEIAVPSTGGAPAVYGCDASGNNLVDEPNDGEWVACTYLTWPDLAAYLDWAGLAPMTEIMFERICRGTLPSALGEFAWGNVTIFGSAYTLINSSESNELASNASTTSGNANWIGVSALRTGIFATATSNRVTSGASFYGVMEMSGNVIEMCVTVGNVAGRAFTSLNGNGSLSANGNANVANWPCGGSTAATPACTEVVSSPGMIGRGGRMASAASELRISDRSNSSISGLSLFRSFFGGGRGVLYIN